jgi:hypothetical protein
MMVTTDDYSYKPGLAAAAPPSFQQQQQHPPPLQLHGGGDHDKADNLRQQTLHQMRRILTTRQAARCFLSIGEYYRRLRALSNLWASRPRENFIGAESLSPTATELQAMHQQQQNQFCGF